MASEQDIASLHSAFSEPPAATDEAREELLGVDCDSEPVRESGLKQKPGSHVGSIPLSALSVVFQPIVHLDTGRLFAYEALARCSSATLSDPEMLFHHAASERVCGALGRELRRLSLKRCHGVPLFLNVHPDELNDRWIVQPDDPLFTHDEEIYLEITESVPLFHFGLVSHTLAEIRARGGVHLVVDDLGAGYSNLRRIADLEPSVVKLDRDLVRGMDANRRQRTLVQAVVRMCQDLGAEVVAEGLETWDELRAARDCGAHYGQGYVLGRPADPAPTVLWPPPE